MKPNLAFGAAILGYATLLSGTPASAKIFSVIYSGSITGGIDSFGVFGPAGDNLTDADITLRYEIDSNTPGSIMERYSPGVSLGGTNESNPLLSVSVTINGFTEILGGIDTYNWGGINRRGFEFDPNYYLDTMFNVNGTVDNITYYRDVKTILYPIPISVNMDNSEIFSDFIYNVPNDEHLDSNGLWFLEYDNISKSYLREVNLSYRVTGVVIRSIPEAGSWTLLTSGFFLASLCVSRRRKLSR